ncbi:MAG TPA: DinB family protein [Galbitalea sp.]|jgi:hypothetical protein
MPIVPDTKNWTWVIERPCAECGYDSSEHPDSSIAAAIRRNASAWPAVLARPDARVRPDDSTWSALEYSAHVRDVLRVYLERLRLMLDTDDPLYPNWDQDASAIDQRYNEQDPAVVAAELEDAAATIATAFDRVDDAGWQRIGRRSDGASFTVSSMSKYLLHDLEHHRWDVAG